MTGDQAQQKTSEKAAPKGDAPLQEGVSKRSIQMKMFTNKVQQQEVALARAKDEPQDKWAVPVGQVIGEVYEVLESVFEHNGQPTTKLYAVGDFEAVVYATGEVIASPQADLPAYYLESVRGALKRNAGASLLFGAEIVLTATGKTIPYAYEVRNLVPREASSPLNRLKAAIAKTGKLRLPPPVALQAVDETVADAAE